MNKLKKFTSVMVLSGVGVGGMMFGSGMIKDVQFARANGEVQTSREQLARAEDLAGAFRGVSKAVEPSVVSISVTKSVKGVNHSLPFNDEQLRRFFPDTDGDGEPDMPDGFGGGPMEQIGTGSGVIMETDGSIAYIITNNHVAGGADEMVVTLNDGRQVKNGKLVGADPKTDLAVIKIEAERLIPAKWGDSGELQKGDWVVAFGSPFGYVGSMTHGIVSALNRQTNQGGRGEGILGRYGYENFIQVDAPINPGNSGGPLVNLKGEVIGINTAIASRSGGFQGIGFAIPANQAKFVTSQLKDKGKVTRGWLGVGIADVSNPAVAPIAKDTFGYKGDNGILVQEVMTDTPASGKLENGDVITKLNGKTMSNTTELRNEIATISPKTEITLSVFRDGKDQDVKLTLGEQPEDLSTARNNRGGRGSARGEDAIADGKSKIGLNLADISDELAQRFSLEKGVKGALVRDVDPKSPAARAGLRPGDVITDIAKQPVNNAKEARELLSKADLSKGVTLYVVSREGSHFVRIEADKK